VASLWLRLDHSGLDYVIVVGNPTMEVEMDKYDKAVEYLMGCNGNFEGEVTKAWFDPSGHPAGSLFAFIRSPGKYLGGCLTMIKRGTYEAETESLTDAIRADTRIPTDEAYVKRKHLPVFAEWQRRIDKELSRV